MPKPICYLPAWSVGRIRSSRRWRSSMIEPDVRQAIYQLHRAGMSLLEISRRLHVSRNAVRRIVQQQGQCARGERRDKKQIDAALVERLYRECDGWVQRIHEKLLEEHRTQVGYW